MTTIARLPLMIMTAAVLSTTAISMPAWSQPRAPVPARRAAPDAGPTNKIVAVVNGDVITSGDVTNRGRLFALSTGLPVTQDVLDRLRGQVIKQLIDERLRLQEAQRRKIAVSDQDIAEAIGEIEQRNGMPGGALGASLRGQGVALRTLIDQIRVQLGWTRVLKQELGAKSEVSAADIANQERVFKASIGTPEFRVGEIFIPVDDPAKVADAQRFADTVIAQLRAGAPFGVVAAQFSQSQTALQGGDLGWVTADELDPAVAAIVKIMPPTAVSNPILVPGGISIVTLRAKREIGRDRTLVANIRQAFFKFAAALNPQAPTEQQKQMLLQAQSSGKGLKSCKDVEDANQRAGASRPSDPGEIRLDGVGSPQLRALLTAIPLNTPSQPIVSPDGIAIIMVCSREEKGGSVPSKQEITDRLLQERVELTSRQLQRDLRRRAILDERGV